MSSELDPQARALIGLALQAERRLQRSPERVRRRVLAALAAPAALGAADAAAASKAASLTGSAVTTKAALLGSVVWLKAAPLVIVGVAASVIGISHLPSTPPVKRVPPPAATAPRVLPRAARPGTPPAPAAEPAATREPAATPVTVAPANPPTALRRAPPSLAADLEALQRAQRTLNAGDAARALQELRAVHGNALRAERTALEVFAHCALGQQAQARERAVLFRQLAPHSPLLPRIDASCAAKRVFMTESPRARTKGP